VAAHTELGPEYHDAVVDAFVARVEREVDARVRVRLAATRAAEAAPLRRGTLLKGLAVGAGAGALMAFAAISVAGAHAAARPAQTHTLPYYFDRPAPGAPAPPHVPAVPARP